MSEAWVAPLEKRAPNRIPSPDDTLAIALSLVAAGWYVFPVDLVPGENGRTDKKPLTMWQGQEGGTTIDPDVVKTWWLLDAPGAWIGVYAGRTGIVVVDVDKAKGDDGRDGKRNLKAAGIEIPETLSYRTRSGGKHHVFRAPKGTELTIARDIPVPGVDIRAGNGLMVYYGPRLFELTGRTDELPKAPKWAVIEKTTASSGSATKREVTEWLQRARDGKAPKPTRKLAARIAEHGTSHDTLLEVVNALVAEGTAGTPGVPKLLTDARTRYLEHYPKDARHFDNALAGSVAHYGLPKPSLALSKAEKKAIAERAKPKPPATREQRTKAVAERHEPAPDEEAEAFDGLSDSHLAAWLAPELAPRWAFTDALGLLRWSGKVWQPTHERALVERVRRELTHHEIREHELAAQVGDKKRLSELPRLLTANKAKAVAGLIIGILAEKKLVADQHPELLNTQSGVVDLRTKELRPHDPELLFTKITAGEYIPGATSRDWQKALTALPPKVAAYLQVRFGQAATGYMTPDDKLVLLRGSGSNGKSTIVEGVREALGEFCVTVPERLLLANPGDHPTELTTLLGARLALIEELPEGRSLNVKRTKDVVGTPKITARRMREDNITWRATHTLMLTTNYLPIVSETDHGTWRRLMLILFPFRFMAENDPKRLPSDLIGEEGLRERLGTQVTPANLAAILSWIVDGAAAYFEAGDMPREPKAVTVATEAWREDADPILAYFGERLELDSGFAIPSADMAADFNEWLHSRGHHEWSTPTINARLGEHESFAEIERRKVRFGLKMQASRPMLATRAIPETSLSWKGVRFKATPAMVVPDGSSRFDEIARGIMGEK